MDTPARETSASDNLSAVAWVYEELRKTLETAHKSLRRFIKESEASAGADVDAVDPSVLRTARAGIHQGVGALELVGLPEAATLLRASEAAVQRLISKPSLLTPQVADDIERASFALIDFLARRLAGKAVSPISLFPRYEAVQKIAGADRVHPADLWSMDWSWKRIELDASNAPRVADGRTNAEFEQQMLNVMRGSDSRALEAASTLCAGLAAGTANAQAATLWSLAAAVFEAQAAGVLESDVFTKRVASRLLSQLRMLQRGDVEVSERLALDLLFFCSQAMKPASGVDVPRLAAVQKAYGLGFSEGAAVNYHASNLGRHDPGQVAQARKRVAAAKDSWSAVSGGELHRLGGLLEQFSLVGDSLRRLLPGGDALAQQLSEAALLCQQNQSPPAPELAMEVATSYLYVDALLEEGDFDGSGQADRIAQLAHRIQGVRQGDLAQPLEAWMEELYRRVSDRQTIGSVVQELRSSLADVEKRIDQFHRAPNQREPLFEVPRQLTAMRGVLSVLGVEPAVHALARMRDDVESMAIADVDGPALAQSAGFDRLATNTGALSFLIDLLNVQPQVAKSLFLFDADEGVLKPVMGRNTSTAEAPAPEVAQPALPADAIAQSTEPAAQILEQASLEALPSAQEMAPPAEFDGLDLDLDLDLALPAGDLAPVEFDAASEAAVGEPQAIEAASGEPQLVAEALTPAPAISTPLPAAELEDDAEMREIFLEEAREVIDSAAGVIAELRRDGANMDAMTTLRRAFHTLKGSSRMVGLREFGEAAWACEQVFNARLATHEPADAALLDMSQWSMDHLGQWVDELGVQPTSDRTAQPVQARVARYKEGPVSEAAAADHLLEPPALAVGLAPELAVDLAPEAPAVEGLAQSVEMPSSESSESVSFDFAPTSIDETPALGLAPAIEAAPADGAPGDEPADAISLHFEQVPELTLDLDLNIEPLAAPLLEAEAAMGQPFDDAALQVISDEAVELATPAVMVEPEYEAVAATAPGLASEPEPEGGSERVPELASEAWGLLDQEEAAAGLLTPAMAGSDVLEPQALAEPASPEPLALERLPLAEPEMVLEVPAVALDLELAPELLAPESALDLAPHVAEERDAEPDVEVAEPMPHETALASVAEEVVPQDAAPAVDESEQADAQLAVPLDTQPNSQTDVHLDVQGETVLDSGEPIDAQPEFVAELVDVSTDLLSSESAEPAVESALEPGLQAPEVSLEADQAEAAAATEDQGASEALPELAVEPAEALADDEQVKAVGPLRIGIPLFNIYLAEADEISRRLGSGVAEWASEPHVPVGEHVIALAHSLGGSSATVGFAELSHLARSLEHALTHARQLGRATSSDAALFLNVTEEIRHLLHQFAAGFLKSPKPELLDALAAYELRAAAQLDAAVQEADALAAEAESELSPELALPPELPLVEAEAPASEGSSPADETPVEVATPTPAVTVIEMLAPLAELKPLEPVVAGATRHMVTREGEIEADAYGDDIDAEDAVDAELFPIFEEEAQELLPLLASQLRDWARESGDASLGSACMRTLHTLKGGARLAGAMRLGELAHRLESGIETVLGKPTPDEGDLDTLQAQADVLAQAFESLRQRDANRYADALAQSQRSAAASVEPAAETVPAQADVSEQPEATPAQADTLPASDASVPAERVAEPESAAGVAPQALPAAAAAPAVPEIDWSRFAQPEGTTPRLAADRAQSSQAQSSVRVRSPLLDRLVNQAGEVSITRARIEAEVGQIRTSMSDLTDNLNRLRGQLRDIDLQAETQMSSRMEAAKAADQAFDPLEFDRFTRFQELTRMMAESVNDVATVQRALLRTLESAEDALVAQARLTRDLQSDLLRTRMVEFDGLSDRLYRVVRQAAKETGKQVRLDIVGGSIEVDRGVLDRMTPAFEHILRNSVTHGIEAAADRSAKGKDAVGTVTVSVGHQGNEVAIEFRDDGAGLDLMRIRDKGISMGLLNPHEAVSDAVLANLIFTPGFSTADKVTELAGRGVGMDVVRNEVTAMGGRIETATSAGYGTSFRLQLPLTTAVTQVVMMRMGDSTVAVPSTLIEIVRRAKPAEVEACYQSGTYNAGDAVLPFFWLGALLQHSPRSIDTALRTRYVVIVRSAQQRVAIHVDEVLGNQEVVVKSLGPQLARMPGLAGMTLLASGGVALIYNPVALASVYADSARAATQASLNSANIQETQQRVEEHKQAVAPLILVVDDSLTVRRVTQRLLAREGYRVALAKDGLDALEKLSAEKPELVLSDIEMPRMDGFDLVRNIRGDARLADLPVIMITSRIAQKHRDHAAELGVNHYLGKPYSEDDLLALVARYTGESVAA